MKAETLSLGDIPILVERKQMKSIRLRVREGQAILSAPRGVPKATLQRFLRENEARIRAMVADSARRREALRPDALTDGSTRQVLGRPFTLRILPGDGRGTLNYEEDTVTLYLPDADPAQAQACFAELFRAAALDYLTRRTGALFPLTGLPPEKLPRVFVRDMETRFGSCTPARGTVRYARKLFRYDPECVDYVVLHELTHLLYPNHGGEFYRFLDEKMPDHRLREKRLKAAARREEQP